MGNRERATAADPGRRRGGRTIRWVAVASLALAAMLAASATATNAAIVTGYSSTVGGKELWTDPRCPAGSVPLSAGFSPGTPGSGLDLMIMTTSRIDHYYAGATAAGYDPNGGSLTGYVYCDTESRDAHLRFATVALPMYASRAVTASCPSNRRVISGGFVAGNGSSAAIVPYRSRKESNGWQVAAHNSTDPNGFVRAFAVCQAQGPKLSSIFASARTNPNRNHGLATVEPQCPDGTRSVSWGFNGTPTAPGSLSLVAPLVSERVASGWRLTGWGLSPTDHGRFTGYVYCEPG
jgi:hypothetical protein